MALCLDTQDLSIIRPLHPVLGGRMVYYLNFMKKENPNWNPHLTPHKDDRILKPIISMLNGVQPQAIIQVIDGVFDRPAVLSVTNEYYIDELVEATKRKHWRTVCDIGKVMQYSEIKRKTDK